MVGKGQLDDDITNFVRVYLTQSNNGADVAFTDDSDFAEDLGLDSLDFISLLAALEQHWGVTIDDEAMRIDRFATVGAMRAFLHAAVSGRPDVLAGEDGVRTRRP